MDFVSINLEKCVVTPHPRLFSFWIFIALVICFSHLVMIHAKLSYLQRFSYHPEIHRTFAQYVQLGTVPDTNSLVT